MTLKTSERISMHLPFPADAQQRVWDHRASQLLSIGALSRMPDARINNEPYLCSMLDVVVRGSDPSRRKATRKDHRLFSESRRSDSFIPPVALRPDQWLSPFGREDSLPTPRRRLAGSKLSRMSLGPAW